MQKGSDAPKPELYAMIERKADAQKSYQILLIAGILPVRKAGMREKEGGRKGRRKCPLTEDAHLGTPDTPKQRAQWAVPGGLQGRSQHLPSTKQTVPLR